MKRKKRMSQPAHPFFATIHHSTCFFLYKTPALPTFILAKRQGAFIAKYACEMKKKTISPHQTIEMTLTNNRDDGIKQLR